MAKTKNNIQLQHSNEPQLTISNKLKIRLDEMNVIEPLTQNQRRFFEAYEQSKVMLLHGVAGTGKTFIALYHALEEVLDKGNHYTKVVIVRSAVPSRDIGHLPGDEKEKTEVYTDPYIDICQNLFGRYDAYQRLVEQKAIQFLITSFVRGITLEDSIVIVDECQNMTDMELNSIITRVGERSKIIFCGDFRQTDLYKKTDMSGLKKFMAIADMMPSFKIFEFGIEDIVRSSLVKEYILARLEYENRYGSS
ncbi:MAG: DEAD/DEAH box helicase [Proteobacteria bacterium]|nr:DEAD/DEAH box helicase [Pseudomonadota bacterium]NBP13463.1 DEAD/DEAH box helicase [bacterium]